MLAVETRSAELPRVADGDMAAGDEYCGTKLLTFKDWREVCLKVRVKKFALKFALNFACKSCVKTGLPLKGYRQVKE